MRYSEPHREYGYNHAFARPLTKNELQILCEFTDHNVIWEHIPDIQTAKIFALFYAQFSAKKFTKRNRGGAPVSVRMPRALLAKLGANTKTVAPQTDNVYTFGPDMSTEPFKKGQDMIRAVAGDNAVNTLHEILEAMESFGTEKEEIKEENHRLAAQAGFERLRDQLNAQFPVAAAAQAVTQEPEEMIDD